MANLHPNYKPFKFILTTGEEINTRSTAHGSEMALYIDINTHPAWKQNSSENYVNKHASEISKFNKKFQGINILTQGVAAISNINKTDNK